MAVTNFLTNATRLTQVLVGAENLLIHTYTLARQTVNYSPFFFETTPPGYARIWQSEELAN